MRFVADVTAEVNAMRQHESVEIARLRGELGRIERRLKAIVDAIADGVSARTLKEEQLSLESRRDDLEAALAAARTPQPLIHPGLAEEPTGGASPSCTRPSSAGPTIPSSSTRSAAWSTGSC